MTDLYTLQGPTKWAAPPAGFSFSSLHAIDACPRRWQMLRSEWGEHARFPQRAHPKAVEGNIVHRALELLIRALGRAGRPALGSTAFREVIREMGFWELFRADIDEANAAAEAHPRAGGDYVIRTAPRELANRAIRLFREQYVPASAQGGGEPSPVHPLRVHSGAGKTSSRAAASTVNRDKRGLLQQHLTKTGALTEVKLTHPLLAFSGFIDLVRMTRAGVEVVDFKTGKEKPEHIGQVYLYALLWWRETGVIPVSVALQYLNHRKVVAITEAELVRTEQNLMVRITRTRCRLEQKPPEATVGEDCRYCEVRAHCDPGWRAIQSQQGHPKAGTIDMEITVEGGVIATGFTGRLSKKKTVAVVYNAAVGERLPLFGDGDRLRVLGGVVGDEGKSLEVRAWTEVYVGGAV